MQIGTLTVEILPNPKGRTLRVQGYPFGHETPVTLAELEALAAHLQQQAEIWRAEISSHTKET